MVGARFEPPASWSRTINPRIDALPVGWAQKWAQFGPGKMRIHFARIPGIHFSSTYGSMLMDRFERKTARSLYMSSRCPGENASDGFHACGHQRNAVPAEYCCSFRL